MGSGTMASPDTQELKAATTKRSATEPTRRWTGELERRGLVACTLTAGLEDRWFVFEPGDVLTLPCHCRTPPTLVMLRINESLHPRGKYGRKLHERHPLSAILPGVGMIPTDELVRFASATEARASLFGKLITRGCSR